MAFRISIQNRFLVIGLLVIFFLIIEGFIIADAQSQLAEIDDKGQEFLDLDGLTLRQSEVFLASTERLTKLELQGYFNTYIPHLEDESYPNAVTFEDLRGLLDDYIADWIKFQNRVNVRGEDNYNFSSSINIKPIFGLNVLSPIDEGLLDQSSIIIDQSENGAELLLAKNINKFWFDIRTSIESSDIENPGVILQINERNRLVGEFQNITSAIIETFEQISTIETQILETLVGKNDSYSAFALREVGLVRNNLASVQIDIDRVLMAMSSSNLNNPLSISPRLSDLSQTVSTAVPILRQFVSSFDSLLFEDPERASMISLYDALSDVIDPNQLRSNGVNGTIFAFIDTSTTIAEQHNDLINRFETELGTFLSDAIELVAMVTEIITAESVEFKILLSNIKQTMRDNVDNLIQNIIIVLTLVLATTLLPVLFLFRRSLGGLEKKFVEVKEGNLIVSGQEKFANNEIGVMEQGFNIMVENLADILATLQTTSERLAGISEMLVAGAEEASASINNVSDTVSKISSGATEQNLLLGRVTDKLEEHLRHVRDASGQINKASYFVSKVAQRTNILGLNASIEAAKSGQFGKGFSVVAREVRELSIDTKRSANEITDLVENISFSIRNTVEDVIREVQIVSEVAENTATGSEEANASSSEQVIMLSEISETASELSTLATNLNEILQGFNVVLSKKQMKELKKSSKQKEQEEFEKLFN